MATTFPTSLDVLNNPQGTDSVQAVPHAAQHADANDAIEALQSKVGVNGSTDPNSLDKRVATLENQSVDTESIQDIVAGVLEAGTHTNITVTYDDIANKINLASTYGDEQVMDAIALSLTAGTGITKTYDDVANTITVAVDTASIATQSYVTTAISNLVDAAPGLLDTLNEIAAAIGDDANFATTINTAITNAITTANEYTDEAVAGLGNSLPNIYVPISDIGVADGIASLNATGKVPDTQLDIDERIQDVAAKLVTDGIHTNISVSYDDVNARLNFVSEGGASVSIVPTAPTSPSAGDLWLDSDTAILYAFDGSFWVEISGAGGGGGGGGGNFTLSETAPGTPTEGDTWFHTGTAKLYVYYDSFWVEAIASGATGATGPLFVEYKGLWNSGVSYLENDGVTYIGSLWRLNEVNSPAGTIPSTPNWQLIIQKGDKGDTGEIAIGTVETILFGETPTVINTGTTTDAILNFEIPGGRAATLDVGTFNTVTYGNPLTIENSGTVSDAVFDFEIPAGRAATIAVGTVDDVLYGNPPTVVNSGNTSDAVFDFEVPAGRAATLAVGTVATVVDGNPATVVNSGTTSDAVLNFEIPAGPRSTIAIGTVDDVNFGTPSTVTNVGDSTDAIFDFELQTGRAATVAIGTITTGNYLDEVEIENVGTVSDAVLNISIPQGIPGEMHDFNVRETPPPNPVEGLVWYNTTNGRAYVYYDSAWVEYSPGFAGPRGPMFLNYQGAWENTEEYVELDGVTRNGSLWVLENQTSVIGTPPSSPSWSLVVEKGDTGEISVGQVTDVLYGEPPTVTNSGTTIDAVLDFEIPAGRASTIVVGTVDDVDYGNPPTIVNSGDTSDAVFDFEIPAGRAATIAVGTVDDVLYGNPPTVNNSGTTSDAVFDFEVPAGRAATLAVGTVTTVLDGELATVVNSGTTSDALFDFEIPAGPRSTIVIGDVVDVNFGTPSTVTNVGTTSDAIFDFELQTGRASTLAVGTVNTGTYYSQATVENAGTVSDAIFNFSIPQGIPGDFQPGENPPSNPLSGQVWYNTADGRAYVYHDSFWVEFSPGFVGQTGPAGADGIDGTNGSSITPLAVSSNITLQKDYSYFVDTSAARTLTLPATPSLGDTITIYDAYGAAATNNITISRNSTKINGQTEDAIIDVDQAVSIFVYTGTTLGWRFD